MADEVDVASDLIAEHERLSLMAKKPVGIRPMGCCYNCEEEVAVERLFCDSLCREDWELREKVSKMQGAYG